MKIYVLPFLLVFVSFGIPAQESISLQHDFCFSKEQVNFVYFKPLESSWSFASGNNSFSSSYFLSADLVWEKNRINSIYLDLPVIKDKKVEDGTLGIIAEAIYCNLIVNE